MQSVGDIADKTIVLDQIHCASQIIMAKSEILDCVLLRFNFSYIFLRVTDYGTSQPGPYYPLGTVPRAYDIFKAYEGMEGRKNKNKEIKSGKMYHKLKYKTSKVFLKKKKGNSTMSLPVKCVRRAHFSVCV
jgi:hypothetical protein